MKLDGFAAARFCIYTFDLKETEHFNELAILYDFFSVHYIAVYVKFRSVWCFERYLLNGASTTYTLLICILIFLVLSLSGEQHIRCCTCRTASL